MSPPAQDFERLVAELRRVNDVVEQLDDALKPRAVDLLLQHATMDRPAAGGAVLDVGVHEYESLADLFFDAQPRTEADKAIVAGVFVSDQLGAPELTAGDINDALRDLGEDVHNIGRAMTTNLKSKRVMQAGKLGGKKVYRVTATGRQAVSDLLKAARHDADQAASLST